ncbi:MAG: DUF916 and DUF3324 domain-containing protein [Leuconostoc mesenteroides]
MRNRSHYLIVSMVMTIISFSLFVTGVSASEMNFSVNTVIPTNQIDKEKTYFNLKMAPKQEQDVTVTLKNNTKKDITVEIGINTAKTSSNGVIAYSESNIKKDNSLKYNLSKLVKGPDSVVVPASSSKDVTFHISMPDNSFDGILLGGLTFQQKSSEVTQSKSSGTSITNEYQYAVAMLIQGKDTVVQPNLNLIKVKPDQMNYRNVITAELQNDQSVLMSKVSVDAKIYSKNGKKPVYTSIKSDMQIAPNSHLTYPVSLNGTSMKAGDYTLKMKVTATANKQVKKWTFTKDFTIKSKQARDLNKSDVDVKANTNNSNWLYILIGAALLIIIIILIVVIILQRKKNSNQ